ncbi:MAG TPA: peptide chain release factor N(5)-glutamine methyltransferase [Chryseosolibacter sp.]
MINSKQLFHEFISKITLPVDPDELRTLVYRVLENQLGLSKTDILAEKSVHLTSEINERLNEFIGRINRHEPLQYILHEADFYGRKFFVDKGVLIPRPETEELVTLVVETVQPHVVNPAILDIGTGSGCIPITLALELSTAQLLALDKSREALTIAEKNARLLNAKVDFFEHDILANSPALHGLDAIVSNPPYIPVEEKHTMLANVTDFEPHMALFVENKDPFIFYTAIAKAGVACLKQTGFVAVEINERFGRETKDIFTGAGYRNVTIEKDLSGKDRFIVAWKN